MQTIEMIGPSGAGKTTYVKDLSYSPDIYADRLNTYASSLFVGVLLRNLPLNQVVIRRIFTHARPHYERRFISRFPGLLETTASIVRNYEDKESVLNFIFREAAWFEFFSEYLNSDETYVIDDGLYQFHLRLLPIDGWNAKKIMNKLPEPNKLIFVDAEPEICLERQENRSRGRASKLEGLTQTEAISQIETMRSGSNEFISEARNRGIEVEIIDNN